MLSISARRASEAALLAFVILCLTSCRNVLPWRNQPLATEVNLAATIENNLIYLTTVTVDGHPGRYILGASHRRSVVDSRNAPKLSRQPRAQLSEKESVRIDPVFADLKGVADAVIGAEAWGSRAVTIDYRAGLVTYQKEGIHPELMTLYQFAAGPEILVVVDGRPIPAIVDTTSPDTLVLPRAGRTAERGTAQITIAGVDFGTVDVGYGDVERARVGNRLLSGFLVTIDYGKRQVGLFKR